MKAFLKLSAASALIAASAGFAAAQTITTTTVEMTPEQRTTVYRSITRERIPAPPPADFRVSVGADVPSAVELYEVPASVEVVPVQRYRYTVVGDDVVLVDPSTRRVVQIIHE